MFFQIIKYLSFLYHSKDKYSVHSPYVYALITKCFEKEISFKKSKILKKFQNLLFQDLSSINVTDFGAGSRVFKSNSRKVSDIAKNAGISTKNAKKLITLVNHLNAKNILEIGTSLGIGTLALSLGNDNTQITTLEGCPETQKVAKEYHNKFELNNITYKLGNFNKTLKEVTNNISYDLIYFDGNHQKKPTINYFKECLKTIHNDSVFIFDDIHWSSEMEEAWNYIKNHPKVTLTIDTFYWGFVFFREEQHEKEHFILKI